MKTNRKNTHLHMGFSILSFCHALCLTAHAEEVKDSPPANEESQNKEAQDNSLETITITANPWNPSLLNYGNPASVITKEKIAEVSNISLGETLKNEVGVSSSYFGPASSRPIIRANAGERVRILKNGVGTLDVSNTAEDHQVSINPLLADSIEILRGPESLLYGSSAIGGIVNVVDGSIPTENPKEARGEFLLKTESVNKENSGAFKLEAAALGLVWHVSGLHQDSAELRVPGNLASDRYLDTQSANGNPVNEMNLRSNTLPNSDSRTRTGTIGASRIFDDGFFGLSLTGYGSFYGVPGSEQDILDTLEPARAQIEMEQWKVDSRGELRDVSKSISKVRFSSAISNYDHTELSDGEPQARFANNALEGRLEALHESVNFSILPEFTGSIGTQLEYSEFSAIGDSVFIPSSNRLAPGLFAYQETTLIPKYLTLGIGERIEMTDIQPESGFEDRRFFPVALSGGLSWDINGRSDYVAGLSMTFAERGPSATELYADGIHFGRRIAERGRSDLSKERSLGLDLTLKKNTGTLTGGATVFAQEFGNYINLSSTGNRIDQYPEFAYSEIRARMLGFELESSLMLSDFIESYVHTFELTGQVDFVDGSDLSTGGNLPRIPPLKSIIALRYEWSDNLSAKIEGVLVAAQRNLGEGELPTDAYQMLNIGLDTKVPILQNPNLRFFARGSNLSNEEGRVHMSFIKDLAPLPGRSFVAGVRGSF